MATESGELGGWVAGEGPPVVLLHGGPGLSYEYLDEIADDIGGGVRIIAYQQRGVAPSTTSGPFGMEQEYLDFVAVLDALGLERAWVVGHSWGGHLALRLAAVHPERLLGALAVDPIGVVGDGGVAGFEAEMSARLPIEAAAHMAVLNAREEAGDERPGDAEEALSTYWPAYFADPEHIAQNLNPRHCRETQAVLVPQMLEGLETIATALADSDVPIGLLAGGASPIPWGVACRAVANLSPRIQLTVAPHAGHFVWFEAPGSVRAALLRLQAG